MDEFFCIVDKFLSGNYIFNSVENNGEFYKYYLESKEIITSRLIYKEILTELNNSELTNKYLEILKTYNSELIVKSEVHGLSHIIRSSLFLLIISVFEKISVDDFLVVLESILYHDVGRVNDIDDDYHGYNGTKKIEFLKEKYNEDDYKLICSLMTGHCVDDDYYKEVAHFYGITDVGRFYKLLCVIKDADSLDRVREYPYVDVKFLRTDTSRKLLSFAYEFYCNYENNLSN